jgi:AraC-like DNA-binding protein
MTPTDTFHRFVDVLARSLDEPRYAEQLHLSRFHVDRIVSAVAGEPPGALRRRILLERAAHRLLTTGDELLSVALAGGYSSHVAFTRAYPRAYGEVPSVWRRVAVSYELAAPSGLHFKPPGGLRLPARRKVTDMELLQKMVEHHVWLLGEMVDRAAGLPAEALDAPIELSVAGLDERPTARSLLSRLVGQLAMWNAVIENRGYDFSVEEGENPSSMRKRLDGAGPRFLETVRSADFDETFVDALCDPPEVFTYGGMVAHVLTFAAHRRMLVLGALEDAGITDLNGDPMRWVADAA